MYSLDEFNNTIGFLYNSLTGKELQEEYHILIKQIKEMMSLFNNFTEKEFDKIFDKIQKQKEWCCIRHFDCWKPNLEKLKKFPKSLDEIFELLDPIKNGIGLLDYDEYKKMFQAQF